MTIQKNLVIDNSSNKADQDNFIVIHLAPPSHLVLRNDVWAPAFVSADVKDIVYVIDNNGKPVFVKLDCFKRIKFKDITKEYTIPDNGWSVQMWKHLFKNRYPLVNDETNMAIYYYCRIK